jgi:hypothetical protein
MGPLTDGQAPYITAVVLDEGFAQVGIQAISGGDVHWRRYWASHQSATGCHHCTQIEPLIARVFILPYSVSLRLVLSYWVVAAYQSVDEFQGHGGVLPSMHVRREVRACGRTLRSCLWLKCHSRSGLNRGAVDVEKGI